MMVYLKYARKLLDGRYEWNMLNLEEYPEIIEFLETRTDRTGRCDSETLKDLRVGLLLGCWIKDFKARELLQHLKEVSDWPPIQFFDNRWRGIPKSSKP